MASPDILDFARLLAPITEDSPAGKDLRQDPSPVSKYQTIKSARSAARAAERKSMHDGDTTEADEQWRKIISLAPDILSNQSKDLEVASWLSEAMIRRYGFQGLRDSFKLIQGLLENHWDGLYPMPDEDGLDTRTSPITGLNGEGAEGVLIAPIRKVPLTQAPNLFSFWQYQQALDIPRGPDSETARQAKIEKLGFSLEEIEKSVAESSSEFFVDQLDDITAAIDYCKNIGAQLEQLCQPEEAPSVRNIISILEECRGAINHIGKDKLPVAETVTTVTLEHTATEQTTMTTTVGVVGESFSAAGAINSRAAAMKQLQEIADFFRKTEPHSPISYVIERSIKWGSMPLNELIVELITEPSALQHFTTLTGVESKHSE